MGTALVRKIDTLGRVTLPKEIRKRIGLLANDPVEILPHAEGILIRPCKDDNDIEKAIERLESVLASQADDATRMVLMKNVNSMRESIKCPAANMKEES